MSNIRSLLGIIGGGSLGILIAHILLGLLTPTVFGVCVAIISACILGIGLVRALQADRRRDMERMAVQRDLVWQRRIRESQTNRNEYRSAS